MKHTELHTGPLQENSLKTEPVLEQWTPEMAQQLYDELETQCWNPVLEAKPASLKGRAEVFPAGQIVLKDPLTGELIASLSTNKIHWNGDETTLPTWDEVAGEPTTYEHTYCDDGNTLVLMSMNVKPTYRKGGYARQMVSSIQTIAQELGVEHLIGSFRPNEYGQYKLDYIEQGKTPMGFEQYVQTTAPRGEAGQLLPVDGWIRHLTLNGMEPLAVDHNAMHVILSLEDFIQHKDEYTPNLPKKWVQIGDLWECGEVGAWTINEDEGIAIYQESNVWGRLPLEVQP